MQPLFKAAGISFRKENLFIVEDPTLNAFVADGNALFIHTGTLIKASSSNELAGVLAHETGHIMGGHILRQKLKSRELSHVSLASAIVAGTAAVLSGRGDAAFAVLMGGQSSALSHYLHYRTAEERSADEAAVKLLSKTHQSPQGILDFMKKIKRENELSGREEMPYFRTHPITTERISFFEKAVQESSVPPSKPDDRFLRIQAKLKAYLQSPEQTLREYPLSRTDIPAQYAHAIAFMKRLKFDDARQKMDTLLSKEANNPFFYEMKGQILLENGKLKEAKPVFAKAYALLPQSSLMQLNYAQVLLEDSPDKAAAQKAVSLLQKAQIKNPSAYGWRLLAQAYGLTGDMAAATYASAEYSFTLGNKETAQKQLKEAQTYPASKQLQLKIDDLIQRLAKD